MWLNRSGIKKNISFTLFARCTLWNIDFMLYAGMLETSCRFETFMKVDDNASISNIFIYFSSFNSYLFLIIKAEHFQNYDFNVL